MNQYLEALEEPKRGTLALLRQRILDVLPDAEQGISYGVPAFRVRGKTIAGFAAFKNHLSYLPHSGSVFPQLAEELTGYPTSTGALRFDITAPCPPRWSRSWWRFGSGRRFPGLRRRRPAAHGAHRPGTDDDFGTRGSSSLEAGRPHPSGSL